MDLTTPAVCDNTVSNEEAFIEVTEISGEESLNSHLGRLSESIWTLMNQLLQKEQFSSLQIPTERIGFISSNIAVYLKNSIERQLSTISKIQRKYRVQVSFDDLAECIMKMRRKRTKEVI